MFLGVVIFWESFHLLALLRDIYCLYSQLPILFVMTRWSSGKAVTGAVVFFYSCLIVFISLNQVATGAVSRSMVQEIETRGLLGDTDPGSLVTEATGNLFPDLGRVTEKHYVVIPGPARNAIVTVKSSPAPGIHKALSLVRREDAATAGSQDEWVCSQSCAE